MSFIADPLVRANFGQTRLKYPFVRAHYGLVDFFKYIKSFYRLSQVLAEFRETLVVRERI